MRYYALFRHVEVCVVSVISSSEVCSSAMLLLTQDSRKCVISVVISLIEGRRCYSIFSKADHFAEG